MAAGPEFYQSEEKKSYSTVFLLVVGLLLACTIWAIWQDSFSRHLWKKIKADFYRVAIGRYEQEKVDEEKRLAGTPPPPGAPTNGVCRPAGAAPSVRRRTEAGGPRLVGREGQVQ